MSATVAGVTGNPDGLEETPQSVGPNQAHSCEYPAHSEVLPKRRVQAGDREDQDLREDRDAIADGYVSDGFAQRHQAGLFHAASRCTASALKVLSLPSKTASLPVNFCQRWTATST